MNAGVEDEDDGEAHEHRGAADALLAHSWPGNVRELKNVVERLVIMTDDKIITGASLGALVSQSPARGVSVGASGSLGTWGTSGTHGGSGPRSLGGLVDDFERALIASELEKTGWNVSQAAAKLGIDRANLHRKMRRYGISREGDANPSDPSDTSDTSDPMDPTDRAASADPRDPAE
jgi:DNA-binding NtrC family response regulator